jgi:hypothetical protein
MPAASTLSALVGEPISAVAAITQDRNGQQCALQKQQRLDQCGLSVLMTSGMAW